jgi:hypothetical protein
MRPVDPHGAPDEDRTQPNPDWVTPATGDGMGRGDAPTAPPVCRDLQWARRLIAQMRGEAEGRRNSTRDVDAQAPVYEVPEAGTPESYGRSAQRRLERAYVAQMNGPRMRRQGRREPSGTCHKRRLEDCAVGDFVHDSDLPLAPEHDSFAIFVGDDYWPWTFQRGGCFWMRES